jgi:hypothetical protein
MNDIPRGPKDGPAAQAIDGVPRGRGASLSIRLADLDLT